MGKAGIRYHGTLTGRGLEGMVFVTKAEVPSGPLVSAQAVAGVIGSEWTEVTAWAECKLVMRKMGAVTRYAHQHYGGNDCCRKAEFRALGLATYGVSKASMPLWMRMSLDGYWTKSWPKGKVLSWTLKALGRAVVIVEAVDSRKRYEITVERGLTDGSNFVRDLSEHIYWMQFFAERAAA